MKQLAMAAVSVVGMIFILMGCASRAPIVTESGEKVHISVITDPGDPKVLDERQYGHRIEVQNVMQPDLITRLRRSGFDAAIIQSKEDFVSGPGRYLFLVGMLNYNPGSSAARMLVGFGAGAASLTTSYELLTTPDAPILSWEDHVATSQHWSRLPKALNANSAKRVREEIINLQ